MYERIVRDVSLILNEFTVTPVVIPVKLYKQNRNSTVTFIEQANNYHPTTKFTAKVSEMETRFLILTFPKVKAGFKKDSVLDVRTHFKPNETFQYIYTSLHPTRRESKNVSSKERL